MISQSPTFCPCPWTSLNIDQSGRVLPCLNSHIGNLKLGNVHQKTIQEIINGSEHLNLKETIAAGQWHPLCTNCKTNEELTGSSARMMRTVGAQAVNSIDRDINYFQLTDLTVNWSSLCNLTCTYCNPETSTAWQAALNMPIQLIKNEHLHLIELAQEHKATLTGISLGGGEPLLQKSLPEFLQQLDPQQVHLMITTNLAVDLAKNAVYQELKNWPNVSWLISFDNVQRDKFEYVRKGCEWSLFLHNIDLIKSDGIRPVAHPAYSIYCAFDLVEYYEFCEQNDLDIFWCELTHPHDLDVKRLAPHLRKLAQQEIDAVIDKWGSYHNLSIDTLKQYRQRLDYTESTSTINPAEFHRKQEIILKQKHTFAELWPSLIL
jgi:radical SAM protein with 4Fe4S-binding SPASM domain